jgi:transcriptional regulator with XRE-family HTH domain
MSSSLKRLFGKRLCTLRENKKLKQHQLGRMIGKGNKYISDVETGRNYPSPEVIEELAKALQLPVSVFFFDERVDNNPKALRGSIDKILDVSDTKQLRRYLLHMLISSRD